VYNGSNYERQVGCVGIEFELKFRATPEQQDALRANVPGQEETVTMETTYYDTPDSALSGRRYTLRRRMENGRSVCTLKTPAGELGRGEFEVECPDIEAAIPILCKLSGLPDLLSLTASGVIPVCGARFTRIAKTITLEDCTVELALDRGILSGGGKEIPLCEVEAELKSGSRDAACMYAAALAATYGLTPEHHSKFRRALALYKGE
jgi:inorganic triphosphatase YgiF